MLDFFLLLVSKVKEIVVRGRESRESHFRSRKNMCQAWSRQKKVVIMALPLRNIFLAFFIKESHDLSQICSIDDKLQVLIKNALD